MPTVTLKPALRQLAALHKDDVRNTDPGGHGVGVLATGRWARGSFSDPGRAPVETPAGRDFWQRAVIDGSRRGAWRGEVAL